MSVIPARALVLMVLAAVLTAASHVGAAGRDSTEQFDLLVVGDSLIWGQGLNEQDKFYSLTADWLRSRAFGKPRQVDVKVKAHSGSTLKFHQDEAEKYDKAGRKETFYYDPEVNVAFPSSWKQIEVAGDEYRAAGKEGADLIMISGGITDISTKRVFDLKGDDGVFRDEIKKYCLDDMYDVLKHAVAIHPNAQLAVIGYFPAITTHSMGSKVLNAWLEILSFPRALKFLANNPIYRKLLFGKQKKRAIVRSQIWYEESNRNFQLAVDRINAEFGPSRAVFVQSPLTEDNAAEAPNTMLFRMGKGGVVTDPKARERVRACRSALPELKRSTGIDYSVRLCEIAAIGHPDPAGARAYASVIESALTPFIRKK
ncbi:MAG: hypothetical protein AB7J13_01815 [Pyrinomonadaceae bacterium]